MLRSDGTGAGSAHSDALTLMLDGVGVGAGSAHKDFLIFVPFMLSPISDGTGAGSAHNDSFVSFRFRVMHTCRWWPRISGAWVKLTVVELLMQVLLVSSQHWLFGVVDCISVCVNCVGVSEYDCVIVGVVGFVCADCICIGFVGVDVDVDVDCIGVVCVGVVCVKAVCICCWLLIVCWLLIGC